MNRNECVVYQHRDLKIRSNFELFLNNAFHCWCAERIFVNGGYIC